MLKRGYPLKLPQFGSASVGRFFPSQCDVQVDDARKVIVTRVVGTGYVMLPFTRRVGLYVAMAVEYLPDFRLEDDATYVWGRFSRFIGDGPQLRILGVENPALNLATQTPFGTVANVIGTGLVASEIGRGFTVVRRDEGDDFAMGHLDPPAKPKHQFAGGKDRVVLEDNLSSVYTQARDYLGPFVVEQADASLYVHARVSGAPVIYSIVERSVGEPWRRAYEQAQPLAPPPGPVIGQGQLAVGEARLGFPVNPGAYYIVIENPAPAPLLGMILPAGEQVAYVAYSVEVGDRSSRD
jgi:hypothetical protein